MGFNPVVKAAEYALNLYEGFRRALNLREGERLVARGLRARARDSPSFIVGSGLLPATAFMLARSEHLDLIDAAYSLLDGGSVSEESLEKLKGSIDKEGGGYEILAAVVAKTLNDAGICKLSGQSVAVELAKCLTGQVKGNQLLIAERLVLELLQEFKKYVEAFTDHKERG